MELSELKSASEKSGAQWVSEDVHGLHGVELLVKPMSSPDVQRTIGRLARRAGEELRDGEGILTDEGIDSIETLTLSQAGLLDWKGLTEDGEEILFSVEKAKELLEMPPFWTAVKSSINHVSAVAAKALRDLAKNSKKPLREEN